MSAWSPGRVRESGEGGCFGLTFCGLALGVSRSESPTRHDTSAEETPQSPPEDFFRSPTATESSPTRRKVFPSSTPNVEAEHGGENMARECRCGNCEAAEVLGALRQSDVKVTSASAALACSSAGGTATVASGAALKGGAPATTDPSVDCGDLATGPSSSPRAPTEEAAAQRHAASPLSSAVAAERRSCSAARSPNRRAEDGACLDQRRGEEDVSDDSSSTASSSSPSSSSQRRADADESSKPTRASPARTSSRSQQLPCSRPAAFEEEWEAFEESEASVRRAARSSVLFDEGKNEYYLVPQVTHLGAQLCDCYWQPHEYVAMSQSRARLERHVLQTGGRVAVEGESRRGLGLVCEPETRLARASKIQLTQRAILRMHSEGCSAAKLARFAQKSSEWAKHNALVCAQHDLDAVIAAWTAAGALADLTDPGQEVRADDEDEAAAPSSPRPGRQAAQRKPAREEDRLQDILGGQKDRSFANHRNSILITKVDLYHVDSVDSETNYLASMIRSDSLSGLSKNQLQQLRQHDQGPPEATQSSNNNNNRRGHRVDQASGGATMVANGYASSTMQYLAATA